MQTFCAIDDLALDHVAPELDGLSDIWKELWNAIEMSISQEFREHLRSMLPPW